MGTVHTVIEAIVQPCIDCIDVHAQTCWIEVDAIVSQVTKAAVEHAYDFSGLVILEKSVETGLNC